MQYASQIIDVQRHHDKLADLLFDKNCYIFIDTNILYTLYTLADRARSEFINQVHEWRQEFRVYVPAWVAHEYFVALNRSAQTLFVHPHNSHVTTVEKALPHIEEYAKQVAEPALLQGTQFPDRSTYLRELNQAVASLQKLLKPLHKKKKLDFAEIRDYIEETLELITLSSDIFALLQEAQNEGPARYAHSIPPGFGDADKASNQYGDLIIWKEILQTCREKQATAAILISNESAKGDWTIRPNKQKLPNGKAVANDQNLDRVYLLPAPELVHEFYHHTKSHDFYIIDLDLLVYILHNPDYNHDYTQVAHLAEAMKRGKYETPTQQVITWFRNNAELYRSAVSGPAYWHTDPGEVQIEKLSQWMAECLQGEDIDLNSVEWDQVFVHLFVI